MIASPPEITELQPNEVFVFGANEGGIHGAGAAFTAKQWGARYYNYGRMGQTYGIPTKDKQMKTLSLERLGEHVDYFVAHAKSKPHIVFLVTEIGCGLAGLKPEDIAPMFRGAPDNVRLPQRFIDVLTKSS